MDGQLTITAPGIKLVNNEEPLSIEVDGDFYSLFVMEGTLFLRADDPDEEGCLLLIPVDKKTVVLSQV